MVAPSALFVVLGQHIGWLTLLSLHFHYLQGYGPRPGKNLAAPSPFLLGPFALAFLGLSVAKIALKAKIQ